MQTAHIAPSRKCKALNDRLLAVEGVTIPFHPGAAQYFKEKGVNVE
jgi:TRAP-type uncharacterized transport system substrate-binding protein